MDPITSVRFFDTQFQRQVRDGDLCRNPFEQLALPHLKGRVLDFGCGLGNLAVAAAERGCSVVALDASQTAIEHLRRIASERGLSIKAVEADLRNHEFTEEFDSVFSIGLLMFFDCATAIRQLLSLQSHLRPGGVAVINVLVEGTTYLDMFDPTEHCLFSRDEMQSRFAGWDIGFVEYHDFVAPKEQVKSFVTIMARKPNSPEAI